MKRRGDIAIIAGREWPARVADQRERLVERIQRIASRRRWKPSRTPGSTDSRALRFMELHNYLGHGHRVLSSALADYRTLLAHATEVALPGLQERK
jgi:hypothetical protein